jgi:hypothetical protein
MVLEESLVFNNGKDADEFIRFLKKKGCHAVKCIEGVVSKDTTLTGNLKEVIAFLKKGQELSGSGGAELAGTASALAKTIISGSAGGKPPKLTNAMLLASLELTHGVLKDLMERRNEGDVIYTREDLLKIQKELADLAGSSSREELTTGLIERMPLFSCLGVLEENGLITTGSEGIILKAMIDPDHIIIERNVPDPSAFGIGLLREYDISLDQVVQYTTQVRVRTGPELYFTCDTEEVFTALLDRTVDPECLELLMFNGIHKTYIIDEIAGLLQFYQKISLDEIIQRMESFVLITDEIEEDAMSGLASPEFVREIIRDLRTAKIIRGTDDNLRLEKGVK